jgi:hypothetical protein
MAFDEELDVRVGDAVAPLETVRKKMFGGTCYLLHGNMLVGVWKEYLIARVGDEAGTAALRQPHVVEFDITGHPMRGWIMVEPAGVRGDDLAKWIETAREYVETLPPK